MVLSVFVVLLVACFVVVCGICCFFGCFVVFAVLCRFVVFAVFR